MDIGSFIAQHHAAMVGRPYLANKITERTVISKGFAESLSTSHEGSPMWQNSARGDTFAEVTGPRSFKSALPARLLQAEHFLPEGAM